MGRLSDARKSAIVRHWENRGLGKCRKKYKRSQYVIENKEMHVGNELKRTQNEPQLSAQMRELEPEFETFDIAHVSVAGRDRGMPQGSKLPGWVSTRNTRIVGTN